MIKFKKWLTGVYRVKNQRTNHDIKAIRLDKSERAIHFSNGHFDNFIKSIKQEDILAYPNTSILIDEIAKFHNIKENQVFISPGSDIGIKTFFEISVNYGDKVIITDPCFPMFNVYGELFGANLIKIGYKENLKLNLDKLYKSINEEVVLVALANPVSPIGDYIDKSEISKIAERCQQFSIPLLVDEAYFEYSPGSSIDLINEFDNIAIMRTFSKAHGAAGLRVGYVLANASMIEVLSKWRQMYEVNQIGVKYAIYSLQNIEVTLKYAQLVVKEREKITKLLNGKNVDVISSHTNWIHIHFKKKNNQAITLLNNYKVLFKKDSKIPFDNRNDFIRISICPEMSKMDFFNDLLDLLDN
jgi:histidinol-phosphate aminotransferase